MAERLRPRVELLSSLDLLAGADRNTLERLAAAAEEVALPAGRVVIREGDEPDALWVLERGELSVCATGGGRRAPRTGARDRTRLRRRARAPAWHPPHRHGAHPRESTLLRIDGQDFLSALQASRPSPSLLSVAGLRMARTPGPSLGSPGA